MFQGSSSQRAFVIRCKGCEENVPAMVATLPASWITIRCPLCSEHLIGQPTLKDFRGQVAPVLKKPVRSAQGGAR
jgi:hypothetical protein